MRVRDRRACVVLARVVALVLVVGAAPGCRAQGTQTPTRAVRFAPCPAVRLVPVPADFELVNRSLHRLGEHHMGKVQVFRDGGQQLQLYSGPDLLDELDDLDMTSEEQTVDGSRFQIWSSTVTPELSVAVLIDDTLEPPCDNIGVLTRHVPRDRLVVLLRGLRVAGRR